MIDRSPHLDDREAALEELLGLVAHDVANPLRPRPFGVIVVHPADDVADLLRRALILAGGAQRVVEHDDPPGAADLSDQRLALRVINSADLVLVVEIGDAGAVRHEAEALALENEAVGHRPAVMDLDAMGFAVVAAEAAVAAAGRGDLGDEFLAGRGEVDQVCLDRLGGIKFGDFGHDRLLRNVVLYDRSACGSRQSRHRICGAFRHHTTPSSRRRRTSSGSRPHSSPSSASVCSPSKGGRVTAAGDSDSFTGQPTV